MVHKDIITRRDPFFEAACSDRRRDSGVDEGQSGKVELLGTDAESFNLGLESIYKDRVVDGTLEGVHFGEEPVNEDAAIYFSLAKIHLLAVYLQYLQTAIMVVDKLLSFYRTSDSFPDSGTICVLYENTTGQDSLRLLMTDLFILESAPGWAKIMVGDDKTPSAFV